MKYCIDCKWFIEIEDFCAAVVGENRTYLKARVEKCSSPHAPKDPVYGEIEPLKAKDARTFGHLCTSNANWFEAKEFEPVNEQEADLDDLSTIPFGR